MLNNQTLFSGLDSLNDTLEDLEAQIYDKFEYISSLDLTKLSKDVIQTQVDKICISINNSINPILARKREQVLQSLKQKYIACQEFIAFIKPFIDILRMDFNIDNVISWLKDVASFWLNYFLGPYNNAVNFVVELTPRLTRLTTNITNLTTLQPTIPNLPDGVDVNFDKLKIDIEPFTIDDVIA